jgi:hypothetical protein
MAKIRGEAVSLITGFVPKAKSLNVAWDVSRPSVDTVNPKDY